MHARMYTHYFVSAYENFQHYHRSHTYNMHNITNTPYSVHCNWQCNTQQHAATRCNTGHAQYHKFSSVLQFVAISCCVLHCVGVCCSMLQCAGVCCSVFMRVAVCCSVYVRLQHTHISHSQYKRQNTYSNVLKSIAVCWCVKSETNIHFWTDSVLLLQLVLLLLQWLLLQWLVCGNVGSVLQFERKSVHNKNPNQIW